jgi:hypothetical protein
VLFIGVAFELPRLSITTIAAFLPTMQLQPDVLVDSVSHSTTTARDDQYKYTPLQKQTSFRLLELLPGQQDDNISCNLHPDEIGSSRNYEALSYTWNDPNIKVPTICNGRILQITPNLCACLGALRLRDEPKWLWADAICINQSNIGERNQQVRHMLDIYRNSKGVIVWLGPDEKDESGQSKAQKAKDCIDEITLKLVQRNADFVWTHTSSFSP